MNLLFIQGGSRWKFDNEGNVYTDSNFNEHVWDRYRALCDHLTVILRREETIYTVDEARKRFNPYDFSKSSYIALPDIYRPIKNVISYSKRRVVEKTISEEIKKADRIIVRSLGNIYTNTAVKYAEEYNKPFLVEVTGFAFESMWYHSFHGKLVAIPKEIQYKHLMKGVDYALYVTNKALQKRYPARGKMIGCSDVELPEIDESLLENRLEKVRSHSGRYVLGTAAFLDVGWKGQKYVIKALRYLRDLGIDKFEYEMAGAGTGKELSELIKKMNMEDRVRIIGALPHEHIFSWLEHIDIYIQSSFMEGLCRSIVEAMSTACPVICSDVGGNNELVDRNCLFKKGNYMDLAKKLEEVDDDWAEKQSITNFEKVHEYSKEILEKKRYDFYQQFMKLE